MDFESERIDLSALLEALKGCRNYEGSNVVGFWALLAEALTKLPSCQSARVVAQTEESWKVLSAYPVGRGASHALTQEAFVALCDAADATGYAGVELVEPKPGYLLLVRLHTEDEALRVYAELALPEPPQGGLDALAPMLVLAADTPRLYERRIKERQVQRQFDDYSRALEVLATVNASRKFIPATMALVNEVAARFNASRVCLGWVSQHYIKLCAMSGTDQFERKVQVVQRLEAAMEECRDQEEEIILPAPDGADSISRDHQTYLQESGVLSLMSVPLRFDGAVCAVLTLEREDQPFTIEEAIGLRVIADQTAAGLSELKLANRWFGHRWADCAKDLCAKALGPRHTWMKIGAVTLGIFLAGAAFFPYTYRVKATFIVEPDSLALMPVPFDGFIDEVNVRPGDEITAGTIMVSMDDGELRVEKVRALADLRRFLAEAEQAEAKGNLGEYRVAKELAGQADARLQLADYRLVRADIRAPFDGVLVEGDLRERLGAPVNQGEVLMKFSRLDGLFLEIELPERDIDLLDGSNLGQAAFASRPDVRFPTEIERIEPSAVAGQGANYFVIRAGIDAEDIDWMRPGMTGVAKLDAGKRTLLWRATHRLVDFIRMTFWL